MTAGLVFLALLALLAVAWLYWRHVWFFRNPTRTAPEAPGLLSPADGRVVYVTRVEPGEDVVCIKQGVAARVEDIAGEDLGVPKVVVGVFMSPLDVHYNRAPADGAVESIRHYPPRKLSPGEARNLDMGTMHRRLTFRRPPFYKGAMHIVVNERTVTRLDGEYRGARLPMYVVQIAARTVHGIDSYFRPGERVRRGEIFGMIRIGSQVDLVVPWREGMRIAVRAGDRVRAGETVVIE